MIKNDLVVIIGSSLSFDAPELLEKIQNSKIALISILEDLNLMERLDFFCRYEAGSEEGVMALIAKEILKDKNLDGKTKSYFDELDYGYLSAETNVGEEELEDLHVMIKEAKNPLFIFGKDLLTHKRASNISKFISLIQKYTNFDIKLLGALSNSDDGLEDVEELESFDGTIVFEYFSKEDDVLYGSTQFSIAAKLKDNDKISLCNSDRKFVLDKKLKGTIALMPSKNKCDAYRYKAVKITKRDTL
ncbi:hypothetical protein ACKGJI_01010 [Sulfurospirillum sp. 1307]|jgi:NADH-quinone oxidoreductase subunit F